MPSAETPLLAGSLAARPRLSWSRRLRGKSLGMPWSLPSAAFEEPAVVRRTLIGPIVTICDPSLARQILVEDQVKFPKAELELSIFRALLGQGLLSLEGPAWRRHRRAMAGAFDPRSVAAYSPAMTACAEAFLSRWSALDEGTIVLVGEEMNALALAIIARTLFSETADGLGLRIRDLLRDTPELSSVGLLDLLPGLRERRMAARARRVSQLFADIDAELVQLISRRAQLPDPPSDLLSRLTSARDDTGAPALTEQEIRDEIITMFVAGHDTTATALTWAWYLLGMHPKAERRLHEEVDRVLGGRPAGLLDLPQLPYTRRLVEETLRLYPPAPNLAVRRSTAPLTLCGRRIRAGAFVVISPWAMQRNRRIWIEPEQFDPDRFLPEATEGRPKLSAAPFGAGPHVCIGQTLAVNELMLVLATLAQHYRLELDEPGPVALKHNIILRPADGLPMRLRRRGGRPGP